MADASSAIHIRKLDDIDADVLRLLISGYTTDLVYAVSKSEGKGEVVFKLERKRLDAPFKKTYAQFDDREFQEHRARVRLGHSFGAFEENTCVGIAIAEPITWNSTFTIRELHVQKQCRGRGVGRKLVEAVKSHATAQQSRMLVCETQNTNVPAIDFYRALGFVMDGIDLSFYSNADYQKGEVAVFMKLNLAPSHNS